MNIIDRLAESIVEKQGKALKGLEEAPILKRPKGFFQILEGLSDSMTHHFEGQMGKHAVNLEQYLFERNSNTELPELIGNISGKLTHNSLVSFNKIGADMENMVQSSALPIDTSLTVERKVRREQTNHNQQIVAQKSKTQAKQMKTSKPANTSETRPLIDPDSQSHSSPSMSIDFGFDVDSNIGDAVIGKAARAMAAKQSKAMETMQTASRLFKPKKNFMEFWQAMTDEFSSHLESSMLEHAQNLGKYFSTRERIPIPDFAQKMAQKQAISMNNLRNDFEESMKGYTIRINNLHYSNVQRPVRRQGVKEAVPKSASSPRRKLVEQKTEDKQENSVTHSTPDAVNSATIPRHNESMSNTTMNKISVVHEEPRISANSHVIIKRDIVKQLQERRKKMLEKETKAKQIRTRLIKMDALAGHEDKIAKEKEAKEKINAAVEFVRNLESRKKTASFKITEWRQDTIKRNLERHVENTPNKYGKQKRQLNTKDFYLQDSQMLYSGGANSGTKRISSKKGEKNFILRKPMPYNLYNVNQKEKEKEVFLLDQ